MPEDHRKPSESPSSLALTVIRSDKRVPVRKTVSLGRESVETLSSYPRIKLWSREIHSISDDIDALAEFIKSLAHQPDSALVTGIPCSDIALDTPTRRLKAIRDNHPATLAECSAPWVVIDVDDIPIPERLDPLDPESAIAAVVEMLGAPFTDASYVWQLTASAFPGAERIRVRLFFLVDRPISNEDRKAWGKSVNAKTGIKLVDTSLFSAEHVIYTATPEFRGHDPFPRRIGVVYGESDRIGWDQVEIIDTKSHEYQGQKHGGSVHRSITEWLDVIGDGDGKEGCHNPINQAIIQMVYHRWTTERIKAVIRETVFSAEWNRNRTQAYLKQETSDYKLNASIKGANRFVSATDTPARVTQTRPNLETVSLKTAETKIRETVTRWHRKESAPITVLSVTVGAGKTTAAVEVLKDELRNDPEMKLLWAFPTHEQGEEVRERFGDDLAIRIEGRVREGSEPLCSRPQKIHAIREAGLNRFTARIACESGNQRCQDWIGCSYYRQFRGHQRVRLIPHQYLATPDARVFDGFAGSVSGMVIDESPLGVLIGNTSFSLAKILDGGGVLAEVIEMMRAEQDPENVQEIIKRLVEERDERCAVDVPISGPSGDQEWALIQELKQLAKNKKPSLRPLYIAAEHWLSGSKNLLWMGRNGEGEAVWCAWKKKTPPIERILVLDGTADAETYKALFGDQIEVVEIHVEQNLEVIQAIDTPMGKTKITDPENDGHLAQAVCLARATGSGLISNKAANDLAKEKGYLPEGYPVAHFNALRGVNHMEALDSIVILGRPEPEARSIEAQARALWPTDSLDLAGSYVWRLDGLAKVASHPDSRCDGLLRMFREAEINQAIGRLRAVRSPTVKRAYVLTHTPTGLPGVKQVPFHEIVYPVPLSRLLLKCGGVAPLVPTVMAEKLPEEWGTAKAAERWLDRVLKPPFTLSRYLHKQNGGFKFRVEGQRKPSRALSWHDQFDTWQILEKEMGAKIVDVREDGVREPPPESAEMTTDPAPKTEPSMRWQKPSFLVIPFTSCAQYIQEQIETAFQPWMVPPLIEAQPIGVTT